MSPLLPNFNTLSLIVTTMQLRELLRRTKHYKHHFVCLGHFVWFSSKNGLLWTRIFPGGIHFESRSVTGFLTFFVVLYRLSRRIPGYYLTSGHDHFVLRPYQLITDDYIPASSPPVYLLKLKQSG